MAQPMPTPFTPFPELSRRSVLTLSASVALLAACGGGGDVPDTQQTGKPVADAAADAVAQGLVGAAFGYAGRSGRAAPIIATAGLRRLGASARLARADVFGIGSNTKAMSAAAIGSMVDAGIIRWSTTIVQALPDLAGLLRPEYAQVTLENLLDHRGGMPPFNGSAGDEDRFLAALAAETAPLPQTLSGRRRYVAAWLVQQAPAPDFIAGLSYVYSNAGYALAAAMLESVTGQSFEALFEDHLVRPLALAGTWRMPSEIGADQPAGHEGTPTGLAVYVPDQATLDAEPWERVMAPAGYWCCSAPTYGEWLRWHLIALRGGQTPLAASYLARLLAAAANGYKLGWGCLTINGQQMLWHSGHVAGFWSEVVMDRLGSHAAFGLTNTAHVALDGSSWVGSALDSELALVYGMA